MSTKNEIIPLSIEQLLNGDDNYSIPIYQRNYAWEEREIMQLIQDIMDYIPKQGDSAKHYYLGTLIVYERSDDRSVLFETIDGQQRLTTLSILTSVIRHNYQEVSLPWFTKINLEFSSRKKSSDTLNSIFSRYYPSNASYNENILNAFELCQKILKTKLEENNVSACSFADFLFKSVKILRVSVPNDTELNHYFEIMNNRGEQLEKHEILKSKFLEILNKLDEPEKQIASESFHLIWEACSNMEKYVQYGFTVEQRHALFGSNDWNTFSVNDFYEITHKIKATKGTTTTELNHLTLTEIIEGKIIKVEVAKTEEIPDRFNSIINFSNFLLHVLRVQTRKDIPLDDKRLLKTFEDEFKNASDKTEFAKQFAFYLLKCKFLYDKYLIKREFIAGVDRWSLKRLKWYSGNKVSYVNTFGNENDDDAGFNRTLLLLLSMFHVSTPTLVYKHWLNASLLYLTHQPSEVVATDYVKYLESLAKAFVFDRYLTAGEPKEYYDIIYKSNAAVSRDVDNLDFSKLSFGSISNNLIFNYLDYLLWSKYKDKKKVNSFEYTFRSSVEHYYPRNPMPGFPKLDEQSVHSFGNLCLISHSKNSRLSNQPPTAKKSYYAKNDIDSIKQWVMFTHYDPDNWDEAAIKDHNDKMVECLLADISSTTSFDLNNWSQAGTGISKATLWFNNCKNENKVLLVRALMCFGDIAKYTGSTSGGEKYNLFQWEYIKGTEAYRKFVEFVEINNPASLTEIIDSQLKNNAALKADPYRFIFVKKPEISQYCMEGNFGWINDGQKIVLLKGEKAGNNNIRDLYIHLLFTLIESRLRKECSIGQDELSLALDYDQDEGAIYIEDYHRKARAQLNIRNEEGRIKFDISTYNLRSQSSFSEKLIELGWELKEDGYHIRNGKSTLIRLGEDHFENYLRLKEEFVKLLRVGLRINLSNELGILAN